MYKFFFYLKKYGWIAISILTILIIRTLYVNYLKSKPVLNPNTNTNISNQIATYRSLKPGESTEDDLEKVFGLPIKTASESGQILNEYKVAGDLRTDTAVLKDGKVVFIKQVINPQNKTNSDDIFRVYGIAPYKLYEPFPKSTFKLYVYPQNGIAYLGHDDGTLLEIWYFEPTNFNDFKSTWGKDFLEQKPQEDSNF